MHNRVRMIVASFLVKHLCFPGKKEPDGRDTLVDADLASNTQGWQWVAGCGADVFLTSGFSTPITQGEKFVKKRTVCSPMDSELSNLPNKWLFRGSASRLIGGHEP